jgi:hypothetical protein
MTDISPMDGCDVGPADQVVGTVTRNENPVAAGWQNGVITQIGPGWGVGINQSGWIIVRRNTATGTVAELYKPS